MDRTPAVRCTVVPPYLLSRLAEIGTAQGARAGEPGLREAVAEPARRTLLADTTMRAERDQRARQDLGPVEPGAQRTIYDSGNREELPGAVVRREGDPATGDAAADEAYAGLGDTYDLYLRAFGRESLDGRGAPCWPASTTGAATTTLSGTGRRWSSATATGGSSAASPPRSR